MTPVQEEYVFRQLALSDMERARRSLDYIPTIEDQHLKEALFRDAVISYAKAFSASRGINGGALRLRTRTIPAELKTVHAEIIQIRNRLFAHPDLDFQVPTTDEPHGGNKRTASFSGRGCGRVYSDNLVEPLRRLTAMVHNQLMREMEEIEERYL